MANAAQIADLLTAGMQGPTGPEDVAFHTGVIKSWDRTTGLNVVTINGVDIPNLKTVNGGFPNWYLANDVVVVIRKQTQYFILGKVSAPGGLGGGGIRFQANNVNVLVDTGGVWGDLTGFPNAPSVNVWIGSAKSAMVTMSCLIHVRAGDPALTDTHNFYSHGEIDIDISGATTIPAGTIYGQNSINHVAFSGWAAGQGIESLVSVSKTFVIGDLFNPTSSAALNQGAHTICLKYRTENGTARFIGPRLSVQPF